MPINYEGFADRSLTDNLEYLLESPYPGRGIVLGNSENGASMLQAYWVMGRSENSRNRILVRENDTVRTEAHDPSKVEDPSLIIYNAMRVSKDGEHVISNGAQTDDVVKSLNQKLLIAFYRDEFADSLIEWKFEPDEPNYTPRITAMTTLKGLYHYSIIRRAKLPGTPEHTFGKGYLDDLPNGVGLCFHTYQGYDGAPLPTFKEKPYAIPLPNTATDTARALWDVLNTNNRVAIVAKAIDKENGEVDYRIINQLEVPALDSYRR